MDEKQTYALKLHGNGIDVDKAVTQDVALSILSLLLGGNPSAAAKADASAGPQTTSDYPKPVSRQVTMREFVNEAEPKTNAQRILCIASYLTEFEYMEEFSWDEVKEGFKKAREALPANFSRDRQQVEDFGWVEQDRDNPSKYWLTNSGQAAMQEGFRSAETTTPAHRVRKSRRRIIGVTDKKPDSYVPTLLKDLNLAGLNDFYREYEPRNHAERVLIFIKFLEGIEVTPITADHIYTCYTVLKERLPRVFLQALRDAHGRRYGFINYDSPEDLRLTHLGENHFNHDLVRSGNLQ